MGRNLKPRPYAEGTLTEAGRHARIVAGLRNASKYWKPKMVCLEEACVGRKINAATGKLAKHYTCNSCDGEFVAKNVDVDHIIPLVDPCGFVSWDDLIARLFVEKVGLQVLCKECHKAKTLEEKKARDAYKKENKVD